MFPGFFWPRFIVSDITFLVERVCCVGRDFGFLFFVLTAIGAGEFRHSMDLDFSVPSILASYIVSRPFIVQPAHWCGGDRSTLLFQCPPVEFRFTPQLREGAEGISGSVLRKSRYAQHWTD